MSGLAKLFGDAPLPASLCYPSCSWALTSQSHLVFNQYFCLLNCFQGSTGQGNQGSVRLYWCLSSLAERLTHEKQFWSKIVQSIVQQLIHNETIDTQWSVTLNTIEMRIWWMQWVGWKAEKSGFQLVYGHVDRCETWKRFINQTKTEDENCCLFRFSFYLCSKVPLYYCGAPKDGTTPFHFLWELCLSQLSIYIFCVFWDLIWKRKSAYKFLRLLNKHWWGLLLVSNNKSFSVGFMRAL